MENVEEFPILQFLIYPSSYGLPKLNLVLDMPRTQKKKKVPIFRPLYSAFAWDICSNFSMIFEWFS